MFFSILASGGDKQTRFVIGTGEKGSGKDDKSWVPIMDSFADLADPLPPSRKWGGVPQPDLIIHNVIQTTNNARQT